MLLKVDPLQTSFGRYLFAISVQRAARVLSFFSARTLKCFQRDSNMLNYMAVETKNFLFGEICIE